MFQALLMGAGLLGQAVGAYSSYQTGKQSAAIAQQIAAQEQAAEGERFKQMTLNGRRQQIENIRNAQLARSMSLNSATAQGAQQGSGYSGGQAQISGMERYNSSGITQNLMIGQNMFDINSRISAFKQQQAALGANQAMAQAFSSFGGNLLSAGASFGGNPFMKSSPGPMAVGINSYGAPNQLGQYS